MRNRTTLILVLFGIIFGIASTAYVKDSEKSKRQPASLKGKNLWIPSPVGKNLALLKIEIQQPQSIPESGSEEVQLLARILVNQEMSGDLTYTWTLPDEVSIVEGEINNSLSGVKKGQIVEVRLTVAGFNKEKQRLISLQASGRQGGEILGASALVASRPEDTWEAVAPEMKKAADEQLDQAPKSRRGR